MKFYEKRFENIRSIMKSLLVLCSRPPCKPSTPPRLRTSALKSKCSHRLGRVQVPLLGPPPNNFFRTRGAELPPPPPRGHSWVEVKFYLYEKRPPCKPFTPSTLRTSALKSKRSHRLGRVQVPPLGPPTNNFLELGRPSYPLSIPTKAPLG